jgi:hypothetical protein
MTIEETKEAIKVMQAYVDGERIEFKMNGDWVEATTPIWSWRIEDYRIAKPEPVEICVGMRIYDEQSTPFERTIRMMSDTQCCYTYECRLFIEDTFTICHRYHTLVNGTKRTLKAPEEK